MLEPGQNIGRAFCGELILLDLTEKVTCVVPLARHLSWGAQEEERDRVDDILVLLEDVGVDIVAEHFDVGDEGTVGIPSCTGRRTWRGSVGYRPPLVCSSPRPSARG